MNIAFTGHRDCTVSPEELAAIAARFPGATWIHGGAQGFDSQVSTFAVSHGIPQTVIRPDYARFSKGAPLVRNRQIVDCAEQVFACYDGRQRGGTFYTLRYARQCGKPVTILSPVQHHERRAVPA